MSPGKLISTNKNDSKVISIYLSSLHSPLLPFCRHGRKFLHYWGSSSKGHTPENINRAFQTCHWIDCYIVTLFYKKPPLIYFTRKLTCWYWSSLFTVKVMVCWAFSSALPASTCFCFSCKYIIQNDSYLLIRNCHYQQKPSLPYITPCTCTIKCSSYS